MVIEGLRTQRKIRLEKAMASTLLIADNCTNILLTRHQSQRKNAESQVLLHVETHLRMHSDLY